MTPSRKPVLPPPTTRAQDWFAANWPILTKIVMFVLGTSIIVNEFFISKTKSYPALVAAGGLLGLPLTFGGDSRNGNGKK